MALCPICNFKVGVPFGCYGHNHDENQEVVPKRLQLGPNYEYMLKLTRRVVGLNWSKHSNLVGYKYDLKKVVETYPNGPSAETQYMMIWFDDETTLFLCGDIVHLIPSYWKAIKENYDNGVYP